MREPMNREDFVYVRRVVGTPGRITTVALVVLGLVLGGAVFAVGVLLLFALAAAAIALGAAWVLVHRVRRLLGRGRTDDARPEPRAALDLLVEMGRARGASLDSWLETDSSREPRLDPSMEIGVIDPGPSLRSRPDSGPRPSPDTEPGRQP